MIEKIVVIAIIASAVFFIGRKFYREFFTEKKDCDGCGLS
jgi:hypothetical protein